MKRAERLWTLGAYLAFASSALSVLLTLLLALLAEHTASDDVARGIGSNVAQLAGQTATRLDRAMYERYREIELMSARVASESQWSEVRRELDAARESYRFYAWLGVADEDGIVRAASGGLLQGQDVSARPWFDRARRGAHLGDVHEALLLARALGPADAPPRFFDIAFPLRPGDARSPVLAAHVKWDWATDLRQAILVGAEHRGTDALIVSAQGVVLLGPADTQGKPLQLASVRRAGAERAAGYVTESWPDGHTYLVGYASTHGFQSSPGLGWRVLVRQPLETAYAPVRDLQRRVLLGGVALALVFSVLGWLASRAVTRPLMGLAAAARRLEEGTASSVEPSQAYREVRVLGLALNSLVARLGQKSEQLTRLNAELEQRVEQRTAELRGAFQRVQANEHRIQTIIEAGQDPFVGMDLQGRITDWNTQAEIVFGWGREEALGRSVMALLPRRHAVQLRAALRAYARHGRFPALNRPIELVMRDRQGREIPVEAKMGLVATGDERFFAAFVHDISHRKEVERMKDEFISTVSHELRTPLTATYGSLNLLASGLAGELPEEARQLVAISHESTERLIRLINDLLDLEKIASGKIVYRFQPQPLRPLVQQAIRDTQAYAAGLRVALRLLPGDDAEVRADADRIVQVCVNLLSNAAKFSPPGGQVEVTVQVMEGLARVDVVDHGPGIPPEFRERVFQRFAQADASDRRAKGGTGLGLAICRSIVEAHGGRLGFDSEPGLRTAFFFELPLAPAA